MRLYKEANFRQKNSNEWGAYTAEFSTYKGLLVEPKPLVLCSARK